MQDLIKIIDKLPKDDQQQAKKLIYNLLRRTAESNNPHVIVLDTMEKLFEIWSVTWVEPRLSNRRRGFCFLTVSNQI